MTPEVSEERILIWAPRGRDAVLVQQLLAKDGLKGTIVRGIDSFCAELESAAGCAITSEDELTPAAQKKLAEVLARQPPWSDFPLIVLGPEIPYQGVRPLSAELGNVIALDRPVSARGLLGAVHQALRVRRRQYAARRAIFQRDHFLAMLGHELRNPLSAIVSATELLEATTRDPQVGARLRLVDRQARHLARLVDDLLDVTRLTTGKLILRRQPTEMSEVVDRCLEIADPVAHSNGVRLVRGPIASSWVDGDPVRLEQVLTNLVVNAIKYTNPGGEVRVWVASAGGDCQLHVRDQGLGIAPDRLEKIFELFEQNDETLERSRGGLGIGLTLVKNLVELHGGSVSARSEGIGTGSEFTIRLPTIAAPPAREERPARPLSVGRGLRVVLVEDNPDIREATQELLELLGCAVRGAADGPSGFDCIAAGAPDLALVDVGLPGFSGYELARRVRQAGFSDVKLVALTGYGQAEDRQQALASGFDRHLVKPVGLEELQALIGGGTEVTGRGTGAGEFRQPGGFGIPAE